jgi:hypothetical protein
VDRRKAGNGLGELHTDLRRFPPSHAAIADELVTQHKIKWIWNSDRTFDIEASTVVRQVADRAIDRRPATVEGDTRSLENALARFIPALRRSPPCVSIT